MGERYWLWVGARLLVGVAIVAWAMSYLGTGSGEKEFQKSLDAMKQVHSFRATYSATPAANQHSDMLWEVDCNRGILHSLSHTVATFTDPPTEYRQDDVNVMGQEYTRQADGSWGKPSFATAAGSARWVCQNLVQGADGNFLPQFATMIRRGIIQKGDKKTVNGVRCREWLVTMKGGLRGLEHDTICLGLDDHLPYEVTVDWENSRETFSDYNASLQIEIPEGAVQPAKSSTETN